MNDKLICEGINSKGYGIIPKLIMQDRTIHATAKCIYAYFCSFAGAGALCFPTRSKICYDLCISIDTFGKYLRQLIEHGYIKCEQIKENGRFSHNVYTLCSTISPCPKISDTENTVYDNLDTNNNNIKSNNINKSNSLSEKENEKQPKKENKKFTPPTIDEVKAYCDERNNHVDPEKFVTYYDSVGWYVGKKKMKNWKSSVILWEKGNTSEQSDNISTPSSYDISAYENYSIFDDQ